MFYCTKNEYHSWADKGKLIEYETSPCVCKECQAEYLANAYSYDKSDITFTFTDPYTRDVNEKSFTSLTTIGDIKLYVMQYIDKDLDAIKLTCGETFLSDGEKTLGEYKVPRRATIRVSDMTSVDYAIVASGKETTSATTSKTSQNSDVGFDLKCFKNL